MSNFSDLSKGSTTSTNPNIDLAKIRNKLLGKNIGTASSPTQLDLYQLVNFLLNLLSRNTEIQFDDTVYVMFINLLKHLLAESEPSRVHILSKAYIDDANVAASSGEHTLELLLNWIHHFMQFNQLGVAASYFSLVHELSENDAWKPRVAHFLGHMFGQMLSAPSLETLDAKLVDFFYAVNFTPISILSGFWVEYKSESRYDGAGILKSGQDFRLAVTKLIYPDQFPNQFYMAVLDPDSRKLTVLKGQKFGSDFRKPHASSPSKAASLELSETNVLKLVEVLKRILRAGVRTDDVGAQLAQLSLTESGSAGGGSGGGGARQAQLNFESMHIQRKKEFNRVFQQLPLGINLLLLCAVTLIKDYVMKKSGEEISIETDMGT